MTPVLFHVRETLGRRLLLGIGYVALSACGADQTDVSPTANATASQSFTVAVDASADAAHLSFELLPFFHVAPVMLDAPDDIDAVHPSASGSRPPHWQAIQPELSMLSTRRLTHQVMASVLSTGIIPPGFLADRSDFPASGATVYTPAQIRAAYLEPPLPTATSLTAAEAATLGAGQTVYLIDAMDDPNAAAELATFDTKFGLPACTTTVIAPAAALPLAVAPKTGCSFSVIYSDTVGTMSATAPAYDAGWSTEIALDVQWAHATAPYARIVLIEAPDSSVKSLTAAVRVANSMGPGIVSQSFGSTEGNWTPLVDSVYQVAHMTYLAAAGDAGASVNWPAVSPNVLAVGGTSLAYSGSGPRVENVWTGTGGGVSLYTPTPTYQTEPVPGLAGRGNRGVADVSFNADPYTGHYIAQIAPGSATAVWLAVGGTSAATPQWAGVLAVANAMRAQTKSTVVGLSQPLLYGSSVGTQAARNFLDIIVGSDGSCSACYAETGYDLPTGLGTPNVAGLLTSLSTGAEAAPTVGTTTVSGLSGTPLTFSITSTASDSVTYSLVSAPPGMSVNVTTGLVTWPEPITGTYSVVAKVLDSTTGLSGQGTISATIAKAGPTITAGPVSGKKNVALTADASVSDTTPGSVKVVASGMPKGMVFTTSGSVFIMKWPKPAKGHYSVTLTATDAKGLSTTAAIAVTISA